MATTLNQYDFANLFNIFEDDEGMQFFNLYNTINIEGDIDPTLYEEYHWSDSDDLYSLSYKYYQTTRLWWTILVANNIIHPFEELKEGMKIKVLKAPVISQIISEINKV